MSLRIKKEHLGKNIQKGSENFLLTSELSQNQLKYISLFISDSFVEEFHECTDKCIEPCVDKEVEQYIFNKTKKKNDKNIKE